MPTAAGQTPTSKRASVDLPEPLGPITPSTSPAWIANVRFLMTATGTPGGAAVTASIDNAPCGVGNSMPGWRGGFTVNNSARRSYALRVLLHCFQTAMTCCTGLKVRPTRIDAAIIMPGVILPSRTSKAPKPSTSDCIETCTNFVIAVTMPAFSLASACKFKNLPCILNQRPIRLGSMPMASMTSALRKLFVARLLEAIAMPLASLIALLDTTSLAYARITSSVTPHSENTPSGTENMKITAR